MKSSTRTPSSGRLPAADDDAVAAAGHVADRQARLVAAAILALMPYHVAVTRQVLLDGPKTFFITLLGGVCESAPRTTRRT